VDRATDEDRTAGTSPRSGRGSAIEPAGEPGGRCTGARPPPRPSHGARLVGTASPGPRATHSSLPEPESGRRIAGASRRPEVHDRAIRRGPPQPESRARATRSCCRRNRVTDRRDRRCRRAGTAGHAALLAAATGVTTGADQALPPQPGTAGHACRCRRSRSHHRLGVIAIARTRGVSLTLTLSLPPQRPDGRPRDRAAPRRRPAGAVVATGDSSRRWARSIPRRACAGDARRRAGTGRRADDGTLLRAWGRRRRRRVRRSSAARGEPVDRSPRRSSPRRTAAGVGRSRASRPVCAEGGPQGLARASGGRGRMPAEPAARGVRPPSPSDPRPDLGCAAVGPKIAARRWASSLWPDSRCRSARRRLVAGVALAIALGLVPAHLVAGKGASAARSRDRRKGRRGAVDRRDSRTALPRSNGFAPSSSTPRHSGGARSR